MVKGMNWLKRTPNNRTGLAFLVTFIKEVFYFGDQQIIQCSIINCFLPGSSFKIRITDLYRYTTRQFFIFSQ